MDFIHVVRGVVIDDVENKMIMDWRTKLKQDKQGFLAGIHRVCVVGLAKSGLAVARLCRQKGIDVVISEAKAQPDAGLLREARSLVSEIELDGHSREFVCAVDCIVISPGVPTGKFHELYVGCEDIPFVGEIEFAGWFCPARDLVAVTGTSGKTTTTHVIGEILRKETGRKVFVCGNIGTPFAHIVSEVSNDDIVVVEVSSFQMETIELFKPRVSVLLNVAPDHLDRYADIADYARTKCRVFDNQSEFDVAVIESEAERYARGVGRGRRTVIVGSDQRLFVAAAVAPFGVTEEAVNEFFSSFKGLPHRLEVVADIDGVMYINDSKATKPHATAFALRKLRGPVVLMAGGRDKGVTYTSICEFRDRLRAVVLFGEARELIARDISGSIPVYMSTTMEEALGKARELASAGDTVLLSPMCASFDQFDNFEHRGNVFRQSVHQLRT
jgi:UDP-N-acetylmuramoylalanine--D-glutamate ligase